MLPADSKRRGRIARCLARDLARSRSRIRLHRAARSTYSRTPCDDIVRLASWPLPTRTQYRFTLPFLTRASKARVDRNNVTCHAHSPFVTGRLALRAARDRGVPLIFTYHTRLEYYAHYAPFDARVTRASCNAYAGLLRIAADAVIAPTPRRRSRSPAMGVRSPIEVIPSGIDVAPFRRGTRSAAMRRRIRRRAKTSSCCGSGAWRGKKTWNLRWPRMAALGPHFRLAIVGGGPERAAFEALAGRMGLAGASLQRRDARGERLPEVYACADVLLFTSDRRRKVWCLPKRWPRVCRSRPWTRLRIARCCRTPRCSRDPPLGVGRGGGAPPGGRDSPAMPPRGAERFDQGAR